MSLWFFLFEKEKDIRRRRNNSATRFPPHLVSSPSLRKWLETELDRPMDGETELTQRSDISTRGYVNGKETTPSSKKKEGMLIRCRQRRLHQTRGLASAALSPTSRPSETPAHTLLSRLYLNVFLSSSVHGWRERSSPPSLDSFFSLQLCSRSPLAVLLSLPLLYVNIDKALARLLNSYTTRSDLTFVEYVSSRTIRGTLLLSRYR